MTRRPSQKERIALLTPNPRDDVLLKSILLPGESGRSAYLAWKDSVDIEEIRGETVSLLPFLYKKFVGKFDDEILNIAKGVYRRTWYINTVLFKEAASTIDLLDKHGIASLVLKGLALAQTCYKDRGIRRMDDVDILVPYDKKESALRLLQREGWILPHYADKYLPHLYTCKHGEELQNDKGQRLDLHWNIFWASRHLRLDAQCWERASRVEIMGRPSLALDPSDQLLHLCIHGLSYRPKEQIRWIVDAASLIANSSIDWELLREQAKERRLSLQLKDSLFFLHEMYHVEIPEAEFDRIQNLPESDKDYLIYRSFSPLRTSTGERNSSYFNDRFPWRISYWWREYMISSWISENDETIQAKSSWLAFTGFIGFMRLKLCNFFWNAAPMLQPKNIPRFLTKKRTLRNLFGAQH